MESSQTGSRREYRYRRQIGRREEGGRRIFLCPHRHPSPPAGAIIPHPLYAMEGDPLHWNSFYDCPAQKEYAERTNCRYINGMWVLWRSRSVPYSATREYLDEVLKVRRVPTFIHLGPFVLIPSCWISLVESISHADLSASATSEPTKTSSNIPHADAYVFHWPQHTRQWGVRCSVCRRHLLRDHPAFKPTARGR